jgi:hypothetical protein
MQRIVLLGWRLRLVDIRSGGDGIVDRIRRRLPTRCGLRFRPFNRGCGRGRRLGRLRNRRFGAGALHRHSSFGCL